MARDSNVPLRPRRSIGVSQMMLQEVDTIQDLKVWVAENMQGATVEEGEDGIVIRTHLGSSMGGYLFERDAE